MELLDPHGALRVVEVDTAVGGVYAASFDLRYEPSLETNRKNWKKAAGVVPGVYRAQAFIFNATHAAEAASNMLFLRR